MPRVLGVDPGSRVTGFGVVDSDGRAHVCLENGCVQTGGGTFPERLRSIYQSLRTVAERHRPEVLAIERVFVHRNADSALKLGQARAAAICAVLDAGLEIHEYAPREVKQALVGTGAAAKEQVQHMVRALLELEDPLAEDAADALALALCHLHTNQALRSLGRGRGRSRSRWGAWR